MRFIGVKEREQAFKNFVSSLKWECVDRLTFPSFGQSLTRGENHYKSNHSESLTNIRGELQACMKKKVYTVTVCLPLNIPFPCAQPF